MGIEQKVGSAEEQNGVRAETPKSGYRVVLWVVLGALFVFCPGPDKTPPKVRIGFLEAGDTVSGVVTVTIYATDNRRVEQVDFFVDDSLQGEATRVRDSVFEFVWDVSGLVAGSEHTVLAVGYDRSGNCDSSEAVALITYPWSGTHHQGTVGTDRVWTAAQSPHYVYGDLMVEAVVTIEPGVEVRLAPDARIVVGSREGGGLRAQGEAQNPIRFLSAVAGERWQGLWFLNNARSADCILKNCIIEEGKGALLTVNNARIKVENCSLRNCAGDGVFAQGRAFTRFSSNVVTGCSGFPVVVDAGAAATLGDNNVLNGNGSNFVEIRGGDVLVSGTWANQGVPLFVTGTVTVAGDSSPILTIAPGCSLLFADSVKFRVGTGKSGRLVADGTYGAITFTGFNGYWQGFEFWNATQSQTLLKSCVVDRAGKNGVAAIIGYVPVNIVGTRITNSASAGIYLFNCGFSQFGFNTITGCALTPLRIEAPYVGSLGSGNQFYDNGKDYIDVVAGVITNDAVWLNHQAPYRINGIVEIGSTFSPMLSIGPGVTLIFAANSGLRIGEVGPGKLVAIGEGDSIVFTGDSAKPGAWRGIDFGALGGQGSILDRCRIVYGSGGGAMGIVTVRSCSPSIINNEIAYSAKYCIALFNSPLDPDFLRRYNWLHDWNEECDDIYDSGP